MRISWIEVWVDGSDALTVYLLRGRSDGVVEALFANAEKIERTFDTYEQAREWLAEDECELVSGRRAYDFPVRYFAPPGAPLSP